MASQEEDFVLVQEYEQGTGKLLNEYYVPVTEEEKAEKAFAEKTTKDAFLSKIEELEARIKALEGGG